MLNSKEYNRNIIHFLCLYVSFEVRMVVYGVCHSYIGIRYWHISGFQNENMELEKIKVSRNRCRSLFNTFMLNLTNETGKRDTQTRTVYSFARHKIPSNSVRFHMVCIRDRSSLHIRSFLLLLLFL